MHKVIFNSGFILVARAIQILASFVVIIVLLPRYFSVADFGDYSFIMDAVAAVMTISFFGIGKLLIRDIAINRARARELTGIAFTVRTGLLVLATFITVVGVWVNGVPDSRTALAVLLAVIFYIVESYAMLFFHVFQAYEKMYFEPLIMFASCCLQVAGIGAVVFYDLGFCAVFLVMVSAALLRGIIGLILMLRSFVVPSFHFKRRELWRFVREAAVVGISVFLYLNLFRINTILLKFWCGSEETAYFRSVYNLMLQLQIFPTALTVAMFPALARRLADPAALKPVLCGRVIRYLALCGATIAWPLFCYSDLCVVFMGEKYAHSIVPLSILAWTSIGLFVDMGANSILVAAGKQNLAVIIVASAIIVNLAIGYFLIPIYGSVGAAVTALVVDFFLLILSTAFIVNWAGRLPRLYSSFAGLALATAAAVFVTTGMRPSMPVFALFMGGAVYLLLLLLTKVISVSEFKEILQARRKPNLPEREVHEI